MLNSINIRISNLKRLRGVSEFRGINSKEAFIRVCTENGYEVSKLPDDWKMLSCYVSAGRITTYLLFTISN